MTRKVDIGSQLQQLAYPYGRVFQVNYYCAIADIEEAVVRVGKGEAAAYVLATIAASVSGAPLPPFPVAS